MTSGRKKRVLLLAVLLLLIVGGWGLYQMGKSRGQQQQARAPRPRPVPVPRVTPPPTVAEAPVTPPRAEPEVTPPPPPPQPKAKPRPAAKPKPVIRPAVHRVVKPAPRPTVVPVVASPPKPPPPPIDEVSIPAVVGLPEEKAYEKLKAVGLSGTLDDERPASESIAVGCVVKTIPSEKQGKVRVGSTIRLVLSGGHQPKCPYCQREYKSEPALKDHLSQELYACSRYPDCKLTASTKEAVIAHYQAQPTQDLGTRLSKANCRMDASALGNKWRLKVVPAPACAHLHESDTWKLIKVPRS